MGKQPSKEQLASSSVVSMATADEEEEDEEDDQARVWTRKKTCPPVGSKKWMPVESYRRGQERLFLKEQLGGEQVVMVQVGWRAGAGAGSGPAWEDVAESRWELKAAHPGLLAIQTQLTQGGAGQLLQSLAHLQPALQPLVTKVAATTDVQPSAWALSLNQ